MDRKTFRSHLNFEVLAKLFFEIAEERYPSGERIKQLVSRLVDPLAKNPLESVHIQIAVLNMMRDMVKEVSPSQMYRSIQHRDDLYLAIIEALEDLEDKLEELEEEEEEEIEEEKSNEEEKVEELEEKSNAEEKLAEKEEKEEELEERSEEEDAEQGETYG